MIVFDSCIGIFIRRFELPITSFSLIYTCTLSSCSLKVLGRGRLHYLLFGDEDVEACDRDTPKDDDKGENGAWSISLHSSTEISKHSAPKLHNSPTIIRLKGGHKKTHKVWSYRGSSGTMSDLYHPIHKMFNYA